MRTPNQGPAGKFSINGYLAGNIGIRGLLHINSIVIGGLSLIPNQLSGEVHISQQIRLFISSCSCSCRPPSLMSILCSKVLGLTRSSVGVGTPERLLVMVAVVVVWLDCLRFSVKAIGEECWPLVAICEHKPKRRWGMITLKGEVVLILLLVLVFLGRLPLFYISISIST